MEQLSSKELKAKKVHRCNYCTCEIAKGETYLRSVHKNEGQVYTWKAHKSCQQIASDMNMFDNADDGVTQDYFIESINIAYHDLKLIELESADFDYPKWRERLEYVKNNYLKTP